MNHKYLLQCSLFSLLLLAILGISGNAEAGLVEIYINDSEELTESETEFVIESGKDINLEIRLSGALRIESDDKNLSVQSIYIDAYFESDTDRRESTAGIPQYQALDNNENDPGYDKFSSSFKGDDARFEGYEGQIRFSIILKNASNEIVPGGDRVILITITSPISSVDENSSESVLYNNPIILGGGFLAFILFFPVLYLYLKRQEELKIEDYTQRKDMEAQMKLREAQRKSEEEEQLKNERVQKRRAMRHQANERERALDYDSAINIWEELGQIDQAARVRKLKVEQGAVKVEQTVIHGDYVDDRDTIVKDSVINRSNIGTGGKSKAEEIKELTELHDSGAIDDAEFKQMKKEILGK